jgi:hypothetical protein
MSTLRFSPPPTNARHLVEVKALRIHGEVVSANRNRGECEIAPLFVTVSRWRADWVFQDGFGVGDNRL